MAGKVAELESIISRDNLASQISNLYTEWNNMRRGKIDEWLELRNYIFATDTKTTTNAKLPWKNTTTLPKICQVRDNLHANYKAAIFPNDDWVKWMGYSEDDVDIKKSKAIEAYISNKARESNLFTTVSQLLYDYIDYGNAFAEVVYVDESYTDPDTGEVIPGYIGPKVLRISPYDHVFNPIAADYKDSPKVTRYIKNIGELMVEAVTRPDLDYNLDVIDQMKKVRKEVSAYSSVDVSKAAGFSVDGFGDLASYYQTDFVEILEFEGTIHDPETNELLENYIITVVDQSYILRKKKNPSWTGKDNKFHVGWRLRPDNLYAMGPLDNLVGIQYRIDHLENIKADLFDLIAHPPLKLRGDVEEFDWEPFARIFVGDDGDVDILKIDATALQADSQILLLEQKMEDFAGAPKQAMGIRTPGEKTAYEVQTLENAAGRIFQEKVVNFEVNMLEPLLNKMLEVARRNLKGSDIVRVMDDDLGVAEFLSITKEDITAKGKIRPVGARHFAATAQLIQNLVGSIQIAASIPGVLAHVSNKKLAKLLFEDVPGLDRFDLVSDNISVLEQAETQRVVQQAQEDLEVEAQTPAEPTEEDDALI